MSTIVYCNKDSRLYCKESTTWKAVCRISGVYCTQCKNVIHYDFRKGIFLCKENNLKIFKYEDLTDQEKANL